MHLSAPCVLAILLSGCAAATRTDFRSRYAGKCQDAPAEAEAGAPSPQLEKARAALRDQLDDHESEVRHCYVEALAYREFAGTLVLRSRVSPQGAVESVAVRSNDTGFPALACCVAAVVHGVKLAPTGAPTSLAIDYSFIFRTVRVPPDLTTEFQYHSSRNDALEIVIDAATVQRGLFAPAYSSDGERWTTEENKP